MLNSQKPIASHSRCGFWSPTNAWPGRRGRRSRQRSALSSRYGKLMAMRCEEPAAGRAVAPPGTCTPAVPRPAAGKRPHAGPRASAARAPVAAGEQSRNARSYCKATATSTAAGRPALGGEALLATTGRVRGRRHAGGGRGRASGSAKRGQRHRSFFTLSLPISRPPATDHRPLNPKVPTLLQPVPPPPDYHCSLRPQHARASVRGVIVVVVLPSPSSPPRPNAPAPRRSPGAAAPPGPRSWLAIGAETV